LDEAWLVEPHRVITFAVDSKGADCVRVVAGVQCRDWGVVCWAFRTTCEFDIRKTVATAVPGRYPAKADRFLRWLDVNGYTSWKRKIFTATPLWPRVKAVERHKTSF
jgi:hypothetical protein